MMPALDAAFLGEFVDDALLNDEIFNPLRCLLMLGVKMYNVCNEVCYRCQTLNINDCIMQVSL